MPFIARLYVKSALIFLLAALSTGVLLALRPEILSPAILAALGPVYFHLFLVGWVTQLIFGIAYWMFPRFTREQPRGYDLLAWTSFATLNVGLILRTIGEPLLAAQPEGGWGWLLMSSAGLQWLAGLAFFANTWPRVKER